MRQTEDERIIRLSLPQEECGGGSRFCDGVGHGILDRNAVGYFWDWKKELAVSGAVESYLVILLRIKMKTGSMAYVMGHELYCLFFAW